MESNIILEGNTKNSIKPVSLEEMFRITKQMQYSICKIYKKETTGTGFICKLPYNSFKIPFLITNNHILNEKDIEINKTVTISFNKKEMFRYISIDKSRIVITNKDLDFTIIEIKNKDKINEENILDSDENMIDGKFLNDVYNNESIYTLHYNKDQNILSSFGLIKGINKNKIKHSCFTDYGSSGAPILSLKDFKVVGIHYGFNEKSKLNEGTLIKSVILELSKYKNDNILQEDNNQLFQMNINYNLVNNNSNEQEKIILENEYSKSILSFPKENCERYNILFEDSSLFKTIIIIPPDKDVRKLFDIYKRNRKSKDISKDETLFLYNASFITIDQNKKISEVFQNASKLYVIDKN